MITLGTRAPRLRASARLPRRVTRVVGLGLVLAGCLGCERRAPGPEECLQFADAWLGGERPQRKPRLAIENAFDELVVRCLTEPFDRELVSCVVAGAPRERCRIDYVRRMEAQH